MQSIHYDMLNPSLLARIRAQTGAPVLPIADQSEIVDGVGTYFRLQPGLPVSYIHAGCLQLHGQISAAGYEASAVVVEPDDSSRYSYELTWNIPASSGALGVIVASIGQQEAGWMFNVDVTLPGNEEERLTLEAIELDDGTFLRWLSLWLDVGLSTHAFLSTPEYAAAVAAAADEQADSAQAA